MQPSPGLHASDEPSRRDPTTLSTEPGPAGGSTANVARVYDALLGGKDNYAADRGAACRLVAAVPGAAWAARANRAFLGRAVRYLAGQGITQYLDIGSGLPTRGNVHEVAREANPDARVVYADHDPAETAAIIRRALRATTAASR